MPLVGAPAPKFVTNGMATFAAWGAVVPVGGNGGVPAISAGDVDMPGMNGYELCTKLRSLPPHKKTPVVFVTSLNDFENRANSTMSGGNDFIGKPFLTIELSVKALTWVVKPRGKA